MFLFLIFNTIFSFSDEILIYLLTYYIVVFVTL